jgi:hypothetical protein
MVLSIGDTDTGRPPTMRKNSWLFASQQNRGDGRISQTQEVRTASMNAASKWRKGSGNTEI